VIVTVNVPTAVVFVVVTVKVAALVLVGFGKKVPEAPAGSPFTESETGLAKPPLGVIFTAKFTDLPRVTTAESGEAEMLKVGTVTVNDVAEVPVPDEELTAIGPLDAPEGTVRLNCVSEETVKLAAAPFTDTLVAPVKPLPVSATCVPTGPEDGLNPLTLGGTVTVKLGCD
jgi:hypothetical protein